MDIFGGNGRKSKWIRSYPSAAIGGGTFFVYIYIFTSSIVRHASTVVISATPIFNLMKLRLMFSVQLRVQRRSAPSVDDFPDFLHRMFRYYSICEVRVTIGDNRYCTAFEEIEP